MLRHLDVRAIRHGVDLTYAERMLLHARREVQKRSKFRSGVYRAVRMFIARTG